MLFRSHHALSAVFGLLALTAAPAWAQQASSSGTLFAPPITGIPTTGVSGPTATGASSSSGGLNLNAICGPTLAIAANPAQAAATTDLNYLQMVNYCQAAQTAQKAYSADNMLWKVWAGVAGVCTAACMLPTMTYVCTGASVGGAVADAVETKNFSSALMGIGVAGVGIVMAKKMGNTGKRLGSCIAAATATMQVFMKRSDMGTQQTTENTNLEDALQVADNLGGTTSSSSGTTNAQVIVPSNNVAVAIKPPTAANSLTTLGGHTHLAQAGSGMSDCSGGEASVRFACALAEDANLPDFVAGQPFQKELAKNTGMDPSAFLDGSATPAQSILGAEGGAGMNAADLGTYAGLLGDLASRFDSETPTAVYAGGGGGGSRSAGGDDTSAAIATVMGGLMKQLKGGPDDKEKTDANSLNVVFQQGQAGANREPAYNADDPAFSIFDRVSYRYRYVGPRMFP